MIIDKYTLLAMVSPDRAAGARMAVRWAAAAERDPVLVQDIIRMCGMCSQRVRRFENGVEALDPIDPVRLQIDKGRHELGVELLALMSITPFEIQQLMEINDDFD